ncbi:hypothetical protein ACFPK9_09455 [Rubritalea spongiae]|uniref:Lipoprotein n=1 Tax=Rubritalea spongiae TaxID=430797 RepID=A0ABW5E263_9BACT
MIKTLLTCTVLATASILSTTSCSSTVGLGGAGSSSFASTTIQNTTRARVDSAILQSFRQEGFSLINQTANGFNFQKWGGTSAQVVYGSWFSDGVAVEPQVQVVDIGGGNYTVLCDVYMREHNGNELLDANYKLLASGKLAYHNLLKKIKKQAEGK